MSLLGRPLIDAFMFRNELDLLELRVRELEDVVDGWLVAQSSETHAGTPKPLVFDRADLRWRPWAHRIHTVTVPPCPAASTRTEREHAGRDALQAALDRYTPGTFVVYGDVDEIPDKDILQWVAPKVRDDAWVGLRPRLYAYYLNFRSHQAWSGIALATVDQLRRLGAVAIREQRKSPPVTVQRGVGGWHFSWLGGVEAIQEKLGAWMHDELDQPKFRNPAYIAKRIAEGKELFGLRRGRHWIVPLTEMPQEVQRNPQRYQAYLHPETP